MVIGLLNEKEKRLAHQYFRLIDVNKDGVLTKQEIYVMITLPTLDLKWSQKAATSRL